MDGVDKRIPLTIPEMTRFHERELGQVVVADPVIRNGNVGA